MADPPPTASIAPVQSRTSATRTQPSTSSRQQQAASSSRAQAQAQASAIHDLDLSPDDLVLRPLKYELVLASADTSNTSLGNRLNGVPPVYDVSTTLVPVEASAAASGTTSTTATATPTPVSQTRRVTRIRRYPHHRAPNEGDVLCILIGQSEADRDMTIQLAGQGEPVKARKFFKKGLINSDVYAFQDAQGNKFEWRERRYGYDLSLHIADAHDRDCIARYASGLGRNRPYLEYSSTGQRMLDLVIVTFFALENSKRALSARPSIMRALSRVGSVFKSGSDNLPTASSSQAPTATSSSAQPPPTSRRMSTNQ